MATPSINDLVTYVATKLKGTNWNSNFTKIVDWLTDGTADLEIDTLTTTSDITVGGDTTVTGNVTAAAFVGSGAALTGLPDLINSNYFDNGGMQIYQRSSMGAYTLVKDTYAYRVDRWAGMATGSAVSAGTFTQATASTLNDTGYSAKFAGVTLTGTGVLYFRQRICSRDAIKLKNQIVSMQFMVHHDVGSSVNYTIYVRKANALNDFSAVTAIGNSGATAVPTGTTAGTKIKYENLSLGDCSNGLEVEIKIECGAITTKNFEISNAKLEINTVISTFLTDSYTNELSRCYQYCYALLADAASVIFANGVVSATNNVYFFVRYPYTMIATPTATHGASAKFNINTAGATSLCDSFTADTLSPNSYYFFYHTSVGTLTAGEAAFLSAVDSAAYIIISSEL